MKKARDGASEQSLAFIMHENDDNSFDNLISFCKTYHSRLRAERVDR